MQIYLEYKDEKSNKFWELRLVSESFIVRYGKIGNKGTEKTKVFDDAIIAKKEAEKLVFAKKKKGYSEPLAQIEESKIDRDEAKKQVLLNKTFSKEITRALSFSYGEGSDSSVDVVHGKIGPYEVFDITLCNGNLVIEGLLEDAPNDFSLLIVLGDLLVSDAILAGEVFVTGNMTVEGALVCGSGGDHQLHVGGSLSVDELAVIDHQMNIKSETTYECFFERGMSEHGLAEACFDEDQEPDFAAISSFVREGYRLFDS